MFKLILKLGLFLFIKKLMDHNLIGILLVKLNWKNLIKVVWSMLILSKMKNNIFKFRNKRKFKHLILYKTETHHKKIVNKLVKIALETKLLNNWKMESSRKWMMRTTLEILNYSIWYPNKNPRKRRWKWCSACSKRCNSR